MSTPVDFHSVIRSHNLTTPQLDARYRNWIILVPAIGLVVPELMEFGFRKHELRETTFGANDE